MGWCSKLLKLFIWSTDSYSKLKNPMLIKISEDTILEKRKQNKILVLFPSPPLSQLSYESFLLLCECEFMVWHDMNNPADKLATINK